VSRAAGCAPHTTPRPTQHSFEFKVRITNSRTTIIHYQCVDISPYGSLHSFWSLEAALTYFKMQCESQRYFMLNYDRAVCMSLHPPAPLGSGTQPRDGVCVIVDCVRKTPLPPGPGASHVSASSVFIVCCMYRQRAYMSEPPPYPLSNVRWACMSVPPPPNSSTTCILCVLCVHVSKRCVFLDATPIRGWGGGLRRRVHPAPRPSPGRPCMSAHRPPPGSNTRPRVGAPSLLCQPGTANLTRARVPRQRRRWRAAALRLPPGPKS